MNAAVALLLALLAAFGITPPPQVAPTNGSIAPLPPSPEMKLQVVGTVVPSDISNGF